MSRSVARLRCCSLALALVTGCDASVPATDGQPRVKASTEVTGPSATIYPTQPTPSKPPATLRIPRPQGVACAVGRVRVEPASSLEGESGEANALVTLTNVSSRPCWLQGTPGVAAYATTGKRLPFRTGPAHYVNRKPAAVLLLPVGASAFALIAKYRCDDGPSTTRIDHLRLALPQGGHVGVKLPEYPYMGYCLVPDDMAGRFLAVSPLAATAQATQGWND